MEKNKSILFGTDNHYQSTTIEDDEYFSKIIPFNFIQIPQKKIQPFHSLTFDSIVRLIDHENTKSNKILFNQRRTILIELVEANTKEEHHTHTQQISSIDYLFPDPRIKSIDVI